jgi:putative flippase GtrA
MLGDAAVRVWRLYHTPSGRKLARYAAVSVVSTLVTFAVLGILFYALGLWSEVPDNVVANVAGIFPSYYLNRSWAWGKTGPSHLWREVLPFWAMSFAGIFLAIAAGTLAHHVGVSVLHLHRLGRTVILYGANVGAFGILWIGKFLIINKLFHVHPVAEDASELEPASA